MAFVHMGGQLVIIDLNTLNFGLFFDFSSCCIVRDINVFLHNLYMLAQSNFIVEFSCCFKENV